jgi:hypothetical protein
MFISLCRYSLTTERIHSLTHSLTHSLVHTITFELFTPHSLTHSDIDATRYSLHASVSIQLVTKLRPPLYLHHSLTLTLTHTHTKQIHTWYIPATPLFFTVIMIIVSNANGINIHHNKLSANNCQRKRYLLLPRSVTHLLTYTLTCALSRARIPKKHVSLISLVGKSYTKASL